MLSFFFKAAWSPAPKWMPFLKPLASDLLVLEEQRRQKRRIREQQKIDKEENQRLEKIRKREQKQSSMARSEGREDLGPESGITVSRGIDEDSLDGDDFSNPDGERGGSKSRSRSSGDALLAKSKQKKDKTKIFGSFRDSIQRKKDNMKRFFSNFTENLNLPSKDEILADGFEAPLNSRAQYKRNRTEEGENDLQRKLREAIANEKEVAKREVEQETKEGAKGKGKFFEKVSLNR